jgi:hypothetical protein
MLIKGDVSFTCPKTGKPVNLYKDCIKTPPTKNCPHFKHWGVEGRFIVITCDCDSTYDQYKKDVGEVTP